MSISPEIMNDASFSTNEAILTLPRRAGEIIKSNQKSDYWMTKEGQVILVGKLDDKAGPPTGLCAFGYTAESKALLYLPGDAEEGEWIEVELYSAQALRVHPQPALAPVAQVHGVRGR